MLKKNSHKKKQLFHFIRKICINSIKILVTNLRKNFEGVHLKKKKDNIVF